MKPLTSAQRDHLFLQAALRTGIHKPVLAALYDVHTQPLLPDEETGLGITPANQISLDAVNSFRGQVTIAANTIRSLTRSLVAQAGWSAIDFWQSEQGRYSDRFLQQVAHGFTPTMGDRDAAQLESCHYAELHRAYTRYATADWQEIGKPQSQSFLDDALRSHIRKLANQYLELQSQQVALIELVRLWQGLDHREEAIAYLAQELALPLDSALRFFLRQISSDYAAYPYQREALLQLVRLWHQFDSREATILHLQHQSFPFDRVLDTALIAFVQRLPRLFQGNGQHRNALVEGFRYWQQLDNRPDALITLGVDPNVFAGAVLNQTEIDHAMQQVDRALMDFIRQIPAIYTNSRHQRESILYLGQLWYGTQTQPETIQTLVDELRRSETARREGVDAVPQPIPFPLPEPPAHWTPETIQLHAPIQRYGSFTWAEATSGGLYLPANQTAVNTIAQMATLAQHIRDRLGRPLSIIRWYCPLEADPVASLFPTHDHALGNAITFYCDHLTGRQLYWFLHPWWMGGLGYHSRYPYLCYVDGRSDRVRWLQD
ncbi:MAG: peptidase M15A [Leptolyngbyaceae cyanobacterium bins.302]|nr:peptidase M15A [Leptolyngbyaceae cyanobacterium bins.302]